MIRSFDERKKSSREIEKLISSARICMVSNNVIDWPLTHLSIKNQWMDTDGSIWFTFIKTSIESPSFDDGRMEVFYANTEKGEFLSLSGIAIVATRKDIPGHHSFPFLKTLVNEALGSTLGIVKFVPSEAYCWNNETGKTIPLQMRGTSR